jgi:hypothetical protein
MRDQLVRRSSDGVRRQPAGRRAARPSRAHRPSDSKADGEAMLSYSTGQLGTGWVYALNTALDETGAP